MGTGGYILRRLRARVSDEPTGFVWVIDDKVAASGYPSSKGQVQWLVSQGIGAILTLTPDPLPDDSVKGLSLVLGHVPLIDHSLPDAGELDSGAEFVEAQVEAGRKVLVHCMAGEGRTGCVLAAYLIKYKGMDAIEALKFLRERKPAFVESHQEKAVSEYEASLKR